MIKKYFFLLFIVFAMLISCKSEVPSSQFDLKRSNKEINYIPYFLKVYEADSLYLIKNYDKSHKILDSLFRIFKPLNTEQYKEYETYISCAFALRKKINFKDSILKSIENYGSTERYLKNDSLLDLIIKKERISDFEIESSTKIYRNKLNLNLRDSIIEICISDQKPRVNARGYNIDIQKADSLNQVKLKFIFSKYGFPHEKLIGEFGIDGVDVDLSVVFLHTNDEFRLNFLLPKIIAAVRNGLAYPENYSQSYDRFLEQTSGKQLYGSYNLKREKQNIEYIDKKHLDSIRKSIGLPSQTYKRWRFKKKYGIDPYN